MTWGSGTSVRMPSEKGEVVQVSCHGFPKLDGSDSCDAYHGDTLCSRPRPVLCLLKDGRAEPESIAKLRAASMMSPDKFHAGWAKGELALTPAIRGDAFANRHAADAYCARTLGEGWRMAEFHDGDGGWGFVANGHIDAKSRFWVAINDQPANCWGNSRSGEPVPVE
jgi:hypothetical protein